MLKQKTKAPAKAIEALLFEGALPGETEGLEKAERAEMAAFVAETAARREAGRPSLAIETFTRRDRRRMRLAVVNDDMPFLVDSIAATIAAHDVPIGRIIHPVIRVLRNEKGELTGIDNSGTPESMVFIEMDRIDAKETKTQRTP